MVGEAARVCVRLARFVRCLMKQARLTVATMRRRRYSSYQGELDIAPENLISRDFDAVAPMLSVVQ